MSGTTSSAETIGDRLLTALETISNKVFDLKVTTVIGPVLNATFTGQDFLNVDFRLDPKELACTTINMALGNATLAESQGFANNPAYAQLHEQSLASARAIRSETIDLIVKAIQCLEALKKH